MDGRKDQRPIGTEEGGKGRSTSERKERKRDEIEWCGHRWAVYRGGQYTEVHAATESGYE